MLNSLRNLQFTTKLFLAVVIITLLSVLITTGNAIRLAHKNMVALGMAAIEDGQEAIYNSLKTYDDTLRKKLESDLQLLQREMHSQGKIILDRSAPLEQVLVNQLTKEKTTQQIPQVKIGTSYINNNFDLVDEIEKISGSSATIFQLVDDKLLRISTTVKKLDGTRAVGTFIPSGSEVYKTILRGETFRGKAYVVNDWYLTAYTPFRDEDGKIIGAVYVGQLMLNSEIRRLVSETKIGVGYFFVYDTQGKFLIHPTFDSSHSLYDLVPEFRDHKTGFITYEWNGKTKISFVSELPKWGIFLGVGMNEDDIIAGLGAKMVRNNLYVGILVVLIGISINLVVVRSINRPLLDLAAKSIQVGNGDYTINFHSNNQDAIGQLTNSLGTMVSRAREMLEDIVSSSRALADASGQLGSISKQMVHSAETTTNIADQATQDANEVSENMEAVSSAMEQSTINLDMIASASEEMGNTIRDIAENSARARQTTEQAVHRASKSEDGVQELGEAAKAIGTVTETITEISEQTNLLALNATIEAARAGEAGKGFAVVANEIKELARQTATATGQIKTAIDEIQQQTSVTVKDIKEITKVISDVNDIVSSIVTAVEEQSITTNEIVANVSSASLGISEINASVADSSEMTGRVSSGVSQVKDQSFEVKENSQSIRNSADELSDLASRLSNLVSRFKI